MASRKAEKERLRQERLVRERELAAANRRRRLLYVYGGGAAAVVAAAIVVVLVVSGGSGSSASNTTTSGSSPKLVTAPISTLGHIRSPPALGPLGPEGIPVPKAPLLAPASTMETGSTVDGIHCAPVEQLVYHVHTHLTVFVNGSQRSIPYGVGIVPPRQVEHTSNGPFVAGGSCFYWLHTHANDGIVHIESPSARTYTLGDFFNIWRQPLGPDQVGPAKGKVTSFFNGKVYKGNPQDIPLGSHEQVQLDVGTPLIAPEKVSFAGTGL